MAVEKKEGGSGFVAMKAVDAISGKTVKAFLRRHAQKGRNIRTDAFPIIKRH